jgi:ParB-like chromosome segregation protein Spo0J
MVAKTKPEIVTLPLSSIRPYWRNPRDNHAAVEKVKASILEYGYNQLIAIDKKHVIIAGHTRYLALKDLGWKEASFIVLNLPPKKAKAYRIVDNKTNEFATWTPDLYVELREIDDLPDMQQYFNVDLAKLLAESEAGTAAEQVTNDEVDKKKGELENKFGKGFHKDQEKEITCPKCGETFFIKA